LVQRDADNDFAVLQLSLTSRLPTLAMLSGYQGLPGANVYVMGYPFGLFLSIVDGIIGAEPINQRWHSNVDINPGNSGGPVFNEDGWVIGMASGGIRRYTDPSGRVYE